MSEEMEQWFEVSELIMVMTGADATDEFIEILRRNKDRLMVVVDIAEPPRTDSRAHQWVGLLSPVGEAQEPAAYVLWNVTHEGQSTGYTGRGHKLYVRLRRFLEESQAPCQVIQLDELWHRQYGAERLDTHVKPTSDWLKALSQRASH